MEAILERDEAFKKVEDIRRLREILCGGAMDTAPTIGIETPLRELERIRAILVIKINARRLLWEGAKLPEGFALDDETLSKMTTEDLGIIDSTLKGMILETENRRAIGRLAYEGVCLLLRLFDDQK